MDIGGEQLTAGVMGFAAIGICISLTGKKKADWGPGYGTPSRQPEKGGRIHPDLG
jgi:hypothetical protein